MFFPAWMDSAMRFLGGLSEVETGTMVTQRLLDLPVRSDLRSFFSKVHNRTIDLDAFGEFVSEHVAVAPNEFHVKRNETLLQKIAHNQFNIWNNNLPDTKVDRTTVLKRYGIIFSSIQSVERSNKVQNDAASHGRGEANLSKRLAAVSQLQDITR